MAPPRILHMITPLKHMSPFDVNMALDAGYDDVVAYTNATTEDVYGLIQDAIFSRSPEGIKRQGAFIGGKRAIEALDMMDRAQKAMVPPFEISVFDGKRVVVFGGTGVVAVASAVIASTNDAKAILVGYDGPERVRRLTMEANDRFDVDLGYADGTTEEQKAELAQSADLIFSAGPAGKQILSLAQIRPAKNLKVAADVNAVPPLGIEGVGIKDNGTPIDGTDAVGIGALAIGDVKYKTETGLFKEMIEADKPVYLDFRAAYRLAQDLVS